jgi:hypothetical protein
VPPHPIRDNRAHFLFEPILEEVNLIDLNDTSSDMTLPNAEDFFGGIDSLIREIQKKVEVTRKK